MNAILVNPLKMHGPNAGMPSTVGPIFWTLYLNHKTIVQVLLFSLPNCIVPKKQQAASCVRLQNQVPKVTWKCPGLFAAGRVRLHTAIYRETEMTPVSTSTQSTANYSDTEKCARDPPQWGQSVKHVLKLT